MILLTANKLSRLDLSLYKGVALLTSNTAAGAQCSRTKGFVVCLHHPPQLSLTSLSAFPPPTASHPVEHLEIGIRHSRLSTHDFYSSRDRHFLPRDAMHKRGYCRHAVSCLSVRLSVTFVSCAKTNKDIFEILSPSGSQAILVFPCQTGRR